MSLEQLRDQVCASLMMLAPELEGSAVLVDECLASARQTFHDDVIARFSPEAWARITLIYHKHFLDTGCDVAVADIVVEVIRDAINTSRLDMLTLKLAQDRRYQQEKNKPAPSLSIVRDSGSSDR
ncbi:hypothetical protein [Marinobacter sp. SS21]|uniref:hypothetical protein n=1 Tax=Marinobacter sp. SS21 TaxID=2979460 RepID=UPI00232A95BE|nr:hypothetical protein [Marinobacter sp. SS21]MDC0662082.1 hypothetical protein [Marinobacter sp. SS21]